MGLPVSGKNLFPSNISGLPTWFTIRVSEKGYGARKATYDVLVCMNPASAAADLAGLPEGGVAIWNDAIPLPEGAADKHVVYRVPFDELVAPICPQPKLRKLVVNMVYVGVAAERLGIAREGVERALERQLGEKKKAIAMNRDAMRAGWDWSREHLADRPCPFRVERRTITRNKIVIDGNTAAALGAMFGGVTVVTWYPITPSSSLVESLIGYLERFRKDPETGRNTFCVVQAEDEIMAIGGVVGASWAGARAMTATSGPGVSLMSEFIGLAYFAEIPVVLWDVQRTGPSTGLPTRTSQGDILFLATLSHGDTRHVVLLPCDIQDCFDYGQRAFDLAERLQTPVLVASDLDLGMNPWVADALRYPERPMDRGKVLSAEDLARVKDFARYRDVDGDGIPWRTIPGTNHPAAAYFTRGSGHGEAAEYSEDGETYRRLMDRLRKKWDTARKLVPEPVVDKRKDAPVGFIAYGSTHWAIEESRDRLRELGIETSYLLLKAIPFHAVVRAFLEAHDHVYVVEQNRDGQMADLIRLDAGPQLFDRIRSVRVYDGLPITAKSIVDGVLSQERVGAMVR